MNCEFISFLVLASAFAALHGQHSAFCQQVAGSLLRLVSVGLGSVYVMSHE